MRIDHAAAPSSWSVLRDRGTSWLPMAAVLLTACATPGPTMVEAPDLAPPPPVEACMAMARAVLQHEAPGAQPEFGALERSGYRVNSLAAAQPAWSLTAQVTTHEADGEHARPWAFFFRGDELVAVGAKVPHRTRSGTTDQWSIHELPPNARPAAPKH